MEKKLRGICYEQKQIIKSLKKEIQHIKPGKLYSRNINGKLYFYEYSKGREQSITKKPDRIKALARYEVLKNYIQTLEYNCNILDNAIRNLKLFNTENNKKLCSYAGIPYGVYTEEQLLWMQEPYQRNPYHPEHLQYATTNGIKMRSKSERAIANRLEAKYIAYRPEAPFQLGDKIAYPDFIILLPNGEIVIWEHFGLMDDEAYKQKAQEKIEEYRKQGYVQHKNLICTYEEDIKSVAYIDRIIDLFLC